MHLLPRVLNLTAGPSSIIRPESAGTLAGSLPERGGNGVDGTCRVTHRRRFGTSGRGGWHRSGATVEQSPPGSCRSSEAGSHRVGQQPLVDSDRERYQSAHEKPGARRDNCIRLSRKSRSSLPVPLSATFPDGGGFGPIAIVWLLAGSDLLRINPRSSGEPC